MKTRILGIDYGMARIGLAISDESKCIATSLQTMKAARKSTETAKWVLTKIEELEKTHACRFEEIVLGLPLMMSGKKGFQADEVDHFASLLKALTSIPITLWDERLSSVQADRAMRESNMTRKKRAARSDAVAAVIILQNYLDFKIQKERQEK